MVQNDTIQCDQMAEDSPAECSYSFDSDKVPNPVCPAAPLVSTLMTLKSVDNKINCSLGVVNRVTEYKLNI